MQHNLYNKTQKKLSDIMKTNKNKKDIKNDIEEMISALNKNHHLVSTHCDKEKESRKKYSQSIPLEKKRENFKRYLKSEKGQIAEKKRCENRKLRMTIAKRGLPFKERFLIRKFYKECPEGHVVDHIISIYSGGLHRLDNLQYITKEQNLLKGKESYTVI